MTSQAKVFVPQEPSKFDHGLGLRVPIVDLSPAKVFGELVYLLPSNISPTIMAPIVLALKEKLKHFQPELDFLIAVGDPTFIAVASGIVLARHESMNMLKWDKRSKSYNVINIKL
jgi:hypothetical protein